jgi:hypothetical protein
MRMSNAVGISLGLVAALGTTAAAVPVVPNGPIDRDVVFTVDNGVLGFDQSVGALGALVSMPSAADGGLIEPTSNYPGPYNFGFNIEALLLEDQSGAAGAKGRFDAASFTLTDRDNGDAVLLQGTIPSEFILYELFSFAESLWAGDIPITISGGSLASEFGPGGFIAFNLSATTPLPLVDFSEDVSFSGSITLSVPEPASCALLVVGAMALLRRRR